MPNMEEINLARCHITNVDLNTAYLGKSHMGKMEKRIELTICLPDGISPDSISASFPILKYNKKFIFSYTADDGPVGAYGKVLMAINGKWVDDERYFHLGQAKTTGYTPNKTLGYTDGCGVEHRMPIGVAIWPNCGNVTNPIFMEPVSAPGRYYPYITWGSIPPILDFGGSLYFHNMDDRAFSHTNPLEIIKGLKEDQKKTLAKIGRRMKILMRPDGNDNYLIAAEKYDEMAMSFAENASSVALYPKDDPALYKAVGQRKMYTDNNEADFAWVKGIHDSDNPMWAHLFTHTPLQPIVDLLTSINDAYGKDGDDSAWFATVDEVYEYWYMRKNTTITRRIDERSVTFILSVPEDSHFYYQDLCLNIEGIASLEGVDLKINSPIIGISYGISESKLLVNLNYNPDILKRAEKYTARFELNENETDRDDALYFLSLILPELAKDYLMRIDLVAKPPMLDVFTINNGDDSTDKVNIRCEWKYTKRATHYMLSESIDFVDAKWVEIPVGDSLFVLSSSEGGHTVYCKLKNAFGESNVMSDSINYNPVAPHPPVTVVSFSGVDKQVINPVVKNRVINQVSTGRHDSFPDLQMIDTEGNNSCVLISKLSVYSGTTGLNGRLYAPTVDDSGVYPAEFINKYMCPSSKITAETPCMIRFTGVAAGKYKIRILTSCSSGAYISVDNYQSVFYSANNIITNLSYDVTNNMDNFVELDGVVVSDDGVLDIKFWNDASLTYRPGINLIEIIKKEI